MSPPPPLILSHSVTVSAPLQLAASPSTYTSHLLDGRELNRAPTAGEDDMVVSETSPIGPVFHCGGDLVKESGFVGSEGFPNSYKPNSKCTWRITVPEGNVVKLSFRIFNLEADSQCRYDYLDVYNGLSNLVQKLGRFCGTFRPGTLISTTNTMMLEMVTDEETHSQGFLAYFSAVKPYADDQQFCGGKITKSQGELKTPNWPEKKYPPGTSCSWLITMEPGMVIQVKFDKFLLEGDIYCRYDYVAFFNGGEKDDSHLIGKYCGDQAPEPITSSSNVMLVQFVSDLSLTSDGFLAYYTSFPRGTEVPTTPVPQNPLCTKDCKRQGTIKSSFCASEFGKFPAFHVGYSRTIWLRERLFSQ
uniref:Procollagen C-proteinase enhancer protein n=1 Tax=Takifugu rubripes TaxID=31033 RepID=O57434_TAKRU|nr:procollagen C-proteinase enhancer protein [Takifugu rubripes]